MQKITVAISRLRRDSGLEDETKTIGSGSLSKNSVSLTGKHQATNNEDSASIKSISSNNFESIDKSTRRSRSQTTNGKRYWYPQNSAGYYVGAPLAVNLNGFGQEKSNSMLHSPESSYSLNSALTISSHVSPTNNSFVKSEDSTVEPTPFIQSVISDDEIEPKVHKKRLSNILGTFTYQSDSRSSGEVGGLRLFRSRSISSSLRNRDHKKSHA